MPITLESLFVRVWISRPPQRPAAEPESVGQRSEDANIVDGDYGMHGVLTSEGAAMPS